MFWVTSRLWEQYIGPHFHLMKKLHVIHVLGNQQALGAIYWNLVDQEQTSQSQLLGYLQKWEEYPQAKACAL
jgi:hypothetical protein